MAEILDFPRTKDGAPNTDLLKVGGNGGKGRKSDDEYGRTRSHLTPSEVAVGDQGGRSGGQTPPSRSITLVNGLPTWATSQRTHWRSSGIRLTSRRPDCT